jgi:hypothetical protein
MYERSRRVLARRNRDVAISDHMGSMGKRLREPKAAPFAGVRFIF